MIRVEHIPIEIIEWEDPVIHSDWNTVDFLLKEGRCQILSVGWLSAENDENVVLAGCMATGSGDINASQIIPKRAIISRSIVKEQ